jgi:cyclopropane-fatty-acyl-phospholipid synthase
MVTATLWERKIESWLVQKGRALNVPAGIRLWDGREFTLGATAQPKVFFSLQNRGAIAAILKPSIDALAESYVNGDIDIEGPLADVIDVAYSLSAKGHASHSSFFWLPSKIFRTKRTDKSAIEFHYDVSDAFYRIWLGETMVYSCAYFERGDETLDVAQIKKIDHVLRKIMVQPGQRLLDIGCGWGELVIRAAKEFSASCVGITLSKHQFDTARRRVEEAGLSDKVEIRLQDYRDVTGTFDRITSIGMFEHVGRSNLPAYFSKIRMLLAVDGWAMNHGITSTAPNLGHSPMVGGGRFMHNHVFPNGELAHLGQVLDAMRRGGLDAYDVENLRRHYARTLNLWVDAFEANSQRVRREVDEKKFRIWRVYLAGCAHAFEHDRMSIYQVVCKKAGQHATTLPWSRRYIYDGSGR